MTQARRRIVFALCAIAVSAIVTTAALLGVDIYLHGRYQQSAGFNIWGYRGTPAGRKQKDEYRIVMLGGSAAYGYGVAADDAIPAVLQQLLREHAPPPRYTVVNLAYNNEGAYSFKPTLRDYRWLNYDLVILYEGYNDMAEHLNLAVFRHDSPVFRLTGYLPIFPIIFKEKAAAMAGGGDAGAYYRHDGKTVFHAGLATRAGAGVLDATANVAEALETQLGRISSEPVHHVDGAGDAGSNCASPWTAYCQSIATAIRYAREQGAQVLVATQPYLRGPVVYPRHFAQQKELRAMLQREFAGDRAVAYVDLGDRVDLQNARLSFDHMHLTREGNREAAAAFFAPVLMLAARKGHSGS